MKAIQETRPQSNEFDAEYHASRPLHPADAIE